MKISFNVTSEEEDVYLVTLSSGEDAFFSTKDVCDELGLNLEIVEIDLERLSGDNPTTIRTLSLISERIGRTFLMNPKAVLYYYCDDLAEVPKSNRKDNMWSQEYRSHLFSIMFQRFLIKHNALDIIDITLMIEEDCRPLYMHLIARKEHQKYVEIIKAYIMNNYGK